MTPVKNAQDVLSFIAEGARTAESILADKKVTFLEAFQFVPTLMAAPSILPKLKPALKELESADDEAKAEVVKYAQDNFELTNDKAEGIFEDLIGVLTYGARLVARF